jgi:hypothetical protein
VVFHPIPYEIDEAAKLDGANSWMTRWKVILPISLAPVATMAGDDPPRPRGELHRGQRQITFVTRRSGLPGLLG